VLARQPRRLIRLPLDTFQPDTHIALPGEPVDFDICGSGEWAGISFGESGVVGLADLRRGACSSVILGKRLSLARFRKDGQQLLVGNAEDRMLSILEAPGGRVVVHLPLAVRPDYFCFSADGGQLFVTGAGMDAVVVVYPFWTEVAETTLAGRAPGAMADAVGPDVEFLLVANSQSGQVTIVDVETRARDRRGRCRAGAQLHHRHSRSAICLGAEQFVGRHGGDPHWSHFRHARQVRAAVHHDPRGIEARVRGGPRGLVQLPQVRRRGIVPASAKMFRISTTKGCPG